MSAAELFQKLLVAFPRSKLTEDLAALYVQKLGGLKPSQCDAAFNGAVERHKYKSIPSIAELLAWGQGKEPGRGKGSTKRDEWDAPNIAYAAALRSGSDEDRIRAVTRNNARFEAIRRVEGNPVLSSSFAGCECRDQKHPHSLDEALAACGLDWQGTPLGERKPWESGRDVRPERGGQV